jgi:NAD-dependent deacetylase
MQDKSAHVRELLRIAKHIAVLTGAGISAESGVPTFRSADGLWKNFSASELANPEAFKTNPRRVWEWYGWRRGEMLKASPNPAHLALAELEKRTEDFHLITQNIDNLHRRAGNERIVEIHGNVFRNRCTNCGHVYADETCNFEEPNPLPTCPKCGSIARVDVVWFGEALPEKELRESLRAAQNCDVFLTVGTSALVYPAAHLPILAKESGAVLVEVNIEQTGLTWQSDFSFIGKAGEIIPKFAGL